MQTDSCGSPCWSPSLPSWGRRSTPPRSPSRLAFGDALKKKLKTVGGELFVVDVVVGSGCYDIVVVVVDAGGYAMIVADGDRNADAVLRVATLDLRLEFFRLLRQTANWSDDEEAVDFAMRCCD